MADASKEFEVAWLSSTVADEATLEEKEIAELFFYKGRLAGIEATVKSTMEALARNGPRIKEVIGSKAATVL